MTTDQENRDESKAVTLRKHDVPVAFEPLPNLMPAREEVEGMISLANFWTQPDAKLLPPNVTPQQVVAIMLSGREAGVGPTTALRHYFVVNGKPEPDTQLMLAIAMRNDPSLQVTIKGDATACTVRLTRDRGVNIEFSYTMADADRSGQSKVKRYWNKDKRAYEDGRPGPWQLYPADMLRWAALKRALKIGAPDLTNTVHSTLPIASAERLLGGDRADDVLDAIAIETAADAEPAGGDYANVPALHAEPLVTPADEAEQEAEAVQHQTAPDDATPAREHLRAMLSEANANADRTWLATFLQDAIRDHPHARSDQGRFVIDNLTKDEATALAEKVRVALYGAPPPADAAPPQDAPADDAPPADPDDQPFS